MRHIKILVEANLCIRYISSKAGKLHFDAQALFKYRQYLFIRMNRVLLLKGYAEIESLLPFRIWRNQRNGITVLMVYGWASCGQKMNKQQTQNRR